MRMDEWKDGCREDRERKREIERKVCVKLGFFLMRHGSLDSSTLRHFDTCGGERRTKTN